MLWKTKCKFSPKESEYTRYFQFGLIKDIMLKDFTAYCFLLLVGWWSFLSWLSWDQPRWRCQRIVNQQLWLFKQGMARFQVMQISTPTGCRENTKQKTFTIKVECASLRMWSSHTSISWIFHFCNCYMQQQGKIKKCKCYKACCL